MREHAASEYLFVSILQKSPTSNRFWVS